MATEAGGMHPTGMHSGKKCFDYKMELHVNFLSAAFNDLIALQQLVHP